MEFTKKIILDFCKLSSIAYSNQDKVIESFTNLRPFNKDDNRTVLYNCSKPELIESFDGSGNDCQVYINKYNYMASFCVLLHHNLPKNKFTIFVDRRQPS